MNSVFDIFGADAMIYGFHAWRERVEIVSMDPRVIPETGTVASKKPALLEAVPANRLGEELDPHV